MSFFLSEELVEFDVKIASPEKGIEKVGDLLYKAECVEKRYIDAMIDSYHENGSYFVITPGVAIPHAHFEKGAKNSAVSMITLATPVSFGHKLNDPVSVIFGLSAYSNDQHLEIIKNIVNLLSKKDIVEKLKQCGSFQDFQKIMET